VPGEDQQSAIARVYGEALLRLSEARGESELLLAELQELARFGRERPELAEALFSPLSDPERRREAIERIFRNRASDLFVDTLQVLNARGRLALFPAIVEAYRKLLQEERHILDVHVASAVPLTDAQRAEISALTERLTGNRAHLLERVEPGLLGGLVVRAHDRKFDTSLRSKLDRLRDQLSQRTSQEIILARGRAS